MGIGDNEIRLVESFLEVETDYQTALELGDVQLAKEFKSKLEGIIVGYEAYTYEPFARQLDKYERYSREDIY